MLMPLSKQLKVINLMTVNNRITNRPEPQLQKNNTAEMKSERQGRITGLGRTKILSLCPQSIRLLMPMSH